MPGVTALAGRRPRFTRAAPARRRSWRACWQRWSPTCVRGGAGLRPSGRSARSPSSLAADADLFLHRQAARRARAVARVAEACGAGARGRGHAPRRHHLAAHDGPARSVGEHAAHDRSLRGRAFGGADAITVLPFTWALGRPDTFARRIARNTHLVLQEESALGRVIDPAAGAWYVEKLTDDLARKAWALFQDDRGARAAWARRWRAAALQGEIAASPRPGRAGLRPAVWSLPASRPFRGWPTTASRSSRIRRPLPRQGRHLGAALPARRLAEPFEALRDAADAHARAPGSGPAGLPGDAGRPRGILRARPGCAISWRPAASRRSVASRLHNSADAGQAFAESGAAVACLCASDQVYAELAEATAGALKAAGATRVLLAGRAKDRRRRCGRQVSTRSSSPAAMRSRH